MAIKIVDGISYVTIPNAAKYLGMTTPTLRKVALSEGLEFVNFAENGKLLVSLDSIKAFHKRRTSPPKI